MHPILFQWLGLTFYSYGLMVGLGILGGVWLIQGRMMKRFGSGDVVLPWLITLVITGLMGARLFYALYYPELFWADPVGFMLSSGGMVWYGSLFSGLAVLLLLAWRSIYPTLAILDAMLPGALVGLVFGRMGCFLAGCCYGKPCPTQWYAVQFPITHATHGQPVVPVQLMESLGAGVLLALIYALEKRYTHSEKTHGLASGTFFLGYALLRFILETQRGDAIILQALSASQWMSLAMGIVGLFLLLGFFRKQRTETM
jgi:phosphatidylglycerol---prolipoprotein diacylglyceryl transferase